MSTITTPTHTAVPGNNIMQRDREQTKLLHEPSHIWGSKDPMTGADIIVDREIHPHVEVGSTTIYFENEKTRKAYLDMPIDHPLARIPRTYGATEVESDIGG